MTLLPTSLCRSSRHHWLSWTCDAERLLVPSTSQESYCPDERTVETDSSSEAVASGSQTKGNTVSLYVPVRQCRWVCYGPGPSWVWTGQSQTPYRPGWSLPARFLLPGPGGQSSSQRGNAYLRQPPWASQQAGGRWTGPRSPGGVGMIGWRQQRRIFSL